MHEDTITIISIFEARGQEVYGSEAVTQLEHALQSAFLAQKAKATETLVAAALLHDIGHIMTDDLLPSDDNMNLDDQHESRAYDWLHDRFGPEVADPVKLHVAAKRYLCTLEPDYVKTLSPASHKSFLDQGGAMDRTERANFEAEPHFRAAVELRKWDDLAKVAEKATPSIRDYSHILDNVHR